MKTGDTDARTAADVGGDELGNAAAATKAIATGDTRYVEQVSLDDDVKRLGAMQRAHSDAKARNATERRSMGREVAAVSEQIGELELVLPALAGNEQAPFAMTVRGSTYRERAEAAPALLDSLRQAYVEGKRYGNTKEFPIAELRGVQVRASRMLSSDEIIVTLDVPGRSRSIQAKDFTGMNTEPVGLVRRVENMVADTANYRDELTRRHDHAVTRISELEEVADEPFEHTDELRDKRQRLDSLTAQLQITADSPEAKAKAAEHQARLDAHGRQPGWSLALNPTSALIAEVGRDELMLRAGRDERAAGTGEELTAEQRAIQDVMAGAPYEDYSADRGHAAHGGSTASKQEGGTDRGKNGPSYGR